MADKKNRPLTPVPPDGMEILFFYQCPQCGKHIPLVSPTEPRMISCDACGLAFPIIPVDEHGLHYVRIMLAGGKAAADPDFFIALCMLPCQQPVPMDRLFLVLGRSREAVKIF